MVSRMKCNYVSDPNVDVMGLFNEIKYNPSFAPTTTHYPDSTTSFVNKCLISHEPLTYNCISLPCAHRFNYIPLYTELCLHIQSNKLSIKCPYCRVVCNKLIPYIPIPHVKRIIGVNAPIDNCSESPKCNFILSKGNNKGQMCNKNAIETSAGIFCTRHYK